MGRGEKDKGEKKDKRNNKSVTGKPAGCSNNCHRKTHTCKSLQVTFQRNSGAVTLCHEDIMRE
jgi:hypothetical protein